MNKKAMSAWIWVLIILVVVLIGLVVYFTLTNGGGSSALNVAGSIPQPPALPTG